MKSTSAVAFVIWVTTSSTSVAIRVLRQLYINGTLLDPSTFTTTHTFPESSVTQTTCAEIIINNVSIPINTKVTFVFGSSPTSSSKTHGNIRERTPGSPFWVSTPSVVQTALK